MRHNYILEGRDAVAIRTSHADGSIDMEALTRWAQWFEKADRTVMRTTLIDGSAISTVFLGLDHSFGDGAPQLFETALILSEKVYCELLKREYNPCEVVQRYATWAQAEAGHMEWLERCVPPQLIAATAQHETPGAQE